MMEVMKINFGEVDAEEVVTEIQKMEKEPVELIFSTHWGSFKDCLASSQRNQGYQLSKKPKLDIVSTQSSLG